MQKNIKILKKIFKSDINNPKEIKLKIYNSISNIVGSKKLNIQRYTFESNSKKYDIILKQSSPKILINGIKILSNNNISILIELLMKHKIFDYDNSYFRERKIYKNMNIKFKKYLIPYYGNYKNNIAIKNISINNEYNYKKIITKMIDVYTFYYNKKEIVKLFQLNNHSYKNYKKAKKLILKMYNQLDQSIIDSQIKIEEFINNIEKYERKFENHKTLTHNDFSTRNIFMDSKNLFIYDWELSSYQNPEHDLIELLVYNYHDIGEKEVEKLIVFFKNTLYPKINVTFTNEEYKEILLFNLRKFIAIRLTMLRITNKKLKMHFINQLINNCNNLYNLIERKY